MEKIEKDIEACKCIMTNIKNGDDTLIVSIKKLYDGHLSLDTISNLIYMEDEGCGYDDRRIELFSSNGRRLNGILKNGKLPNYIEDFIIINYKNNKFCIGYCCKREGGNEQYMYYENADVNCIFNVIYILLSFNVLTSE